MQEKIYIAGHTGLVGSAILQDLKTNGYTNLVYRGSHELDLKDQSGVNEFMAREKPDIVILAAAKVGGILANDSYPYTFLYENLAIQSNVIHAAHVNDVQRLVFLGSSCIYPKLALQPLKEDYLMTGPLEPTNEWYAIAKISGLKQCEALNRQYQRNYISLMPANLYGPRDNFDLQTSHVLPALMRKFHEALPDKPVTVWGSGTPRREFLHVDDLAGAVRFCMEQQTAGGLYNIGTGRDISIKELALTIQDLTGHRGDVIWDQSRPDGTPIKRLDTSRINELGWSYTIPLQEGMEQTYNWFLENEIQKIPGAV
ncbi:MAG: GDP-L-fucose synthase [Balneolales bacterium]